MQPRCTCKKEIAGWYFNFDSDSSKFERCDIIGEMILQLFKKLELITKTNGGLINILHRIENEPKVRSAFLSEIKKQTHKTCYGWQCRMKITKHNKLCKIHRKKLLTKKEKK